MCGVSRLFRTSSWCCGQDFYTVIKNCNCPRLAFMPQHRWLEHTGGTFSRCRMQPYPLAHFWQVEAGTWKRVGNCKQTWGFAEIFENGNPRKKLNFLLNWHVSTWTIYYILAISYWCDLIQESDLLSNRPVFGTCHAVLWVFVLFTHHPH